jgi:aminopeptidase N
VNIRVDGAPAGFMLAASAKAEIDQNWYRFNQTNARNFTWSGSDNYQMLESYAGNIRVRAFVFPLDLAAGQVSLDTTVQALNLYSSLFGPYEHDSLTIVEAAFADGMEYDGLYFLGQEYFNAYEGKPGSYLVSISAHETAHQWWYGMITNDQAYDPWLDEALSTYSEVLFYEHNYPDLVNWWWETRVDYFSPKGWVDSSIYDFRSFRPYVNAVYLRGASFLRELRGQLGDEAFLSFLKDYFTIVHERSAVDHFGLAAAEDFWAVLKETTSTDLTSLKSQYFAQP